ncbi:MAG TPA: hypothetical protein VHX14_19760 [Thermoanaerobaculia bacterium]|nr:hypothetical protein [Thermoanaerobaculia bacterium]
MSFRIGIPSLLAAFLMAFGACAHVPSQPSTPTPSAEIPGSYEGQLVVAQVERLELNVHEESLSDGSVIVSSVAAFAVVSPERFDTLLFAHVKGHPHIGDRPILLGDAVTFVLPRNWRNRDLSLDELEGLAFVNKGSSQEP